MKIRSLLLCVLILSLCLGCIACGRVQPVDPPADLPEPELSDPVPLFPSDTPAPDDAPAASVLSPAADYAEVFAALQATRGDAAINGGILDEGVKDEPEADAPAEDSAGSDFSGTNVQVAGVDEGDIVKTDGKYIYILSDTELKIVEALGADTRLLSSTQVGQPWIFEDNQESSKSPFALYILGDRLAVLSNEYSWRSWEEADGEWAYENTQVLRLDIYDISDPASPTLLHSPGQDGYCSDSRLLNGKLYLISSFFSYDCREDKPESYIPRLYDSASAQLLPADCILLPEEGKASEHTLICVYDLESGLRTDNLSLLGSNVTVYMNSRSLYLAANVTAHIESEPYQDSIYTVVDHENSARVQITRFDLEGGLTLAASGAVDGYLLNQFSMDEYDGHLRLVTTQSGSRYSVYTDPEFGFENYVWDEDLKQSNALYILDENLNVTGSITGLAEDERVYSVRFDGEIAYFVTFRETDPLFSVDLSDPSAPAVLYALKIPGFSQYLHVYGEGRLFGLGMDADEETGWTESMKLSMFDTSNPANVTEKHKLLLDSYWSEALYNHKAILIAPDKDLIAFPSDFGYDVYGYSDEAGFYLRGQFSTEGWSSNSRGLYIGQSIYICSDLGVTVVSLDTLNPQTSLYF